MRSSRILVHLMGGVGNQLFQYAAGLGLSELSGATVFVDQSSVEGLSLLDVLPSGVVRVASPVERRQFGMFTSSEPVSVRASMLLLRTTLERLGRLTVITESNTQKAVPPERVAGRCLLNGWFINPIWFESSRPLVAGQLLARLQVHPAYAAVRSAGAAVVSFRRGDFVRWGLDLSLGYYERALEQLHAAGGPAWLVGDDQLFLTFASRWFADRGVDAMVAPTFEGSAGIADLALLAGAQTVVMSNSTFCWWGVAAGDESGQPNRSVVYPDLRHGPQGASEGTSGRWGPPHWTLVPATFGKGAG